VSLRERGDRPRRGPALPLFDAADLALGLRLEDPGILADSAYGSPIPLVEAGATLLGFAKLARVNLLEELVPAEMDIEVRPKVRSSRSLKCGCCSNESPV
jgi:hypothetical protein